MSAMSRWVLFFLQAAACLIAVLIQCSSSNCTLNKHWQRDPKPAAEEMVKVGVGIYQTRHVEKHSFTHNQSCEKTIASKVRVALRTHLHEVASNLFLF